MKPSQVALPIAIILFALSCAGFWTEKSGWAWLSILDIVSWIWYGTARADEETWEEENEEEGK